MPADTPTVYILHGDDDLAISEFIAQLCKKLGDPASAQMNIQRFDGTSLEIGKFQETCTTLPFLSKRRIVILDGVQSAMRSADHEQVLLTLLPTLPQSTALVLTNTKSLDAKSSSLLKWAKKNPDSAYVRHCSAPKGTQFVSWLIKRCQSMGGTIEHQAAHLLSELVANNPRLADRELEKLLDYVNKERAIEVSDVEQLTPFHGQSNVFAMVDAVGQRNGKQAFTHLHRLLEDHPPRYAFSMIIRQFRLLLIAREALDSNKNPRKSLDVPDFVADKVSSQARNFSLTDLERIYHKLLDIDLASKSGGADLEVALDSLLATLAA
jgi:DNA polymerase-3 subunit delta